MKLLPRHRAGRLQDDVCNQPAPRSTGLFAGNDGRLTHQRRAERGTGVNWLALGAVLRAPQNVARRNEGIV